MPRRSLAALTALLLLPSGSALANGNVSHQWVSEVAAEATPDGGSLAEVAKDPALRPMLDTGTMFPDWGYTPGASAQERDAGESAHWEPVQDAYRQWIVEHHAPPWSDEARRHLAFYLGLCSHGIADQSFDAMFFERSRHFEPGDHSEFDQDTDVLWAATTGPGEVPMAWIPNDPMIELFAEITGVKIDPDRMAQQLNFVGVGIAGVNALASDPAQVDDAAADFPWAAAHDDDPAVPGNPPHEAEIARRYWRSNWALLHGDPVPRPVLWTWPADGGADHPTDASTIDSWISVVFARALSQPQLEPSQLHLIADDGTEAAIELDLFYGDGSHVLHIKPVDDLQPDTDYVLTIDPGVATIHGEALDGWSFAFSTGARGPDPINDDGFWDEPDPYPEPPDGSGTTDGDSGPADSTTAAPGDETTGGGSATTAGSTSTTPPADDDSGARGCSCTNGPPTGHSAAFWAIALLVGAPRRRR